MLNVGNAQREKRFPWQISQQGHALQVHQEGQLLRQESCHSPRLLHLAHLPLSGGDPEGPSQREAVDVQMQEYAFVYHPQAAPAEAGAFFCVFSCGKSLTFDSMLWRYLRLGLAALGTSYSVELEASDK